MADDLTGKYDEFYRQRNPEHVYPVEFVVRAYLGSYPRLARATTPYAGTRVLDLGCGDGRNMPLLANLGMTVSGVEISTKICEQTTNRMRTLGVDADVRVGRNCAIPFGEATFEHLLACHSCYYVDPGTRFDDNASEIARVMKPRGRFVFSAPVGSSYILRGGIDRGDGHVEVTRDPYAVRNGYVLRKFDAPEEIERALAPWFEEFTIGACRNDWWGIDEHVWTVVCHRRG